MTEESVLVASFWDGGEVHLLLLRGESPGCLESFPERSRHRSRCFESPHVGVHRGRVVSC